jgi:hypothetical protein
MLTKVEFALTQVSNKSILFTIAMFVGNIPPNPDGEGSLYTESTKKQFRILTRLSN